MGRFLNADALASTGQGVLGYNMFAYCTNSPVFYTDSSGFAAFHTCMFLYDDYVLPVTTPQIAETPEDQISGVINGQAMLPYADRKIGLGSYSKTGCAYIATYNAMQLIGQPQSLASVTEEVFGYGAVAFGAGGAGPWATSAYFNAHNVTYTGSISVDKLTTDIKEGSVITFTAWYPSGWHAMTALYTNGEYWVFNRYDNSTEKRTYSTLSDAYTNGWWIYGFRIDP